MGLKAFPTIAALAIAIGTIASGQDATVELAVGGRISTNNSSSGALQDGGDSLAGTSYHKIGIDATPETWVMTVTNNSASPQDVTLYSSSVPTGNIGDRYYTGASFSPAVFTIPAGQAQNVTVSQTMAVAVKPDIYGGATHGYLIPSSDPGGIQPQFESTGTMLITADVVGGNPATASVAIHYYGRFWYNSPNWATYSVIQNTPTLNLLLIQQEPDIVDVSLTLDVLDFNENPGTVELLIDGTSIGVAQNTGGNALGVANSFSFDLQSTDGDLHGKTYTWLVDGVVAASGLTDAYVYDSELEIGNLFFTQDVHQRDQDDEVIPDPPDEPEEGEWEPPGSDPNAPSGDPGNPTAANMTKADHYDAIRKGVTDGLNSLFAGVSGGSDGYLTTADLLKGDTTVEGLDGATAGVGDVVDQAAAGYGSIRDALPSPQALPSVSGTIYQLPMDLPVLGAFTVDWSGYLPTISILRLFLLLVVSILASYHALAIMRKSSTDS